MSNHSNSFQNFDKTFEDQSNNVETSSKVFQNAKSLLMQCGASGDSLYNHLSNIISKTINDEPSNVVDFFEQFSERVRHETFLMNENLLEEGYKEPQRLAQAQKLLPFLVENFTKSSKILDPVDDVIKEEKSTEAVSDFEEEEDEIFFENETKKNFIELQSYWNQFGIGFPPEETFMLQQSMMKLEKKPSVKSYRFWGKIFGLQNDYYIVECLLTHEALESKIDQIESMIKSINLQENDEQNVNLVPINNFKETQNTPATDSNESKITNESKTGNFDNDFGNYPSKWNFSMKIAESQYRPPVEIPAEFDGQGTNRFVYFASTDLTCDWIELPPVTPHQINVSRRIKKYLTGDLNEEIVSYPKFPGTEKNYLRALIARISAGTSIAPRNFYTSEHFGSDGEESADEEQEETNDKSVKPNPSYRPLPVSNLLKLDFWEHVKPEILKQGRVNYFDPDKIKISASEKDDDDDSEISEETNDETQKEVPVPLFATCSGDQMISKEMNTWSITLCDADEKLVLAKSNLWPGAFVFAKERVHDHIYIGYGGCKYCPRFYSPLIIPEICHEFVIEPGMKECNDPTIDEEELFAKSRDSVIIMNDSAEEIDDD